MVNIMKKKTLGIIVLVILTCLSMVCLGACKKAEEEVTPPESEETQESETPESAEIEETEDDTEASGEELKESVLLGYREVIESLVANEQKYILPFEGVMPVDYTVEDISRDGVPELLVGSSDEWNPAVRYVVVFYHDFVDGETKMAEGSMVYGVAGAGGFRGDLSIVDNEDGYIDLCESAWSSGSGAGETYMAWLENGAIQREFYSSFQIGDDSMVMPETRAISWIEVDNLDYLDSIEISLEALKKAAESEPAEPAEADSGEEATDDTDVEALIADAESRGLQILTGTFLVMNGEELAEYEDMDIMLNGEMGAERERATTYVILELDEPQNVEGSPADGSSRRTTVNPVTHVGVAWRYSDQNNGNGDIWFDFDGKHGTIATDLWFQSDASFPFAPRCADTELILLD